jgi:hypothetical protein
MARHQIYFQLLFFPIISLSAVRRQHILAEAGTEQRLARHQLTPGIFPGLVARLHTQSTDAPARSHHSSDAGVDPGESILRATCKAQHLDADGAE